MSRLQKIVPGEYYHVFNRGAHKLAIVRDQQDWLRVLFLILYSQSPLTIQNAARLIRRASPAEGFAVPFEEQEEIASSRFVEMVAFCIMPNHFHLLLKETEEGGIARYMQRVEGGYTMYFNSKHDSSGHVFQGPYKAVRVKDDRQLMHLSAYIHRNPRELRQWKNKEEHYPYSSLQDYIDKNRWGSLLATDIVAGRFDATPESNYRDFVRTSGAKELAEFEDR